MVLLLAAGLAAQLWCAAGYARCDSKGREDRVLGELRPGVVVIAGAPEKLRGHLDESGVLDGHPYRAFFPMDHLPSCGTAVYARVAVLLR